jgi:2'-hydroxyisoflavone reductase
VKLLIIGGTVFLGRHLVDAALGRGHEVSLFNRGLHNADLFPDVEKLRGDRDGDLDAPSGRRWDAVVDTCGYVPRVVRQSAELLADAVEQYIFISTISVYADTKTSGQDESAPVGHIEDETVEEITGETYGPLKALCEQTVEASLPGRSLTIRPGLIVGPNDPTDRFTYWPVRVAKAGDVLAPGEPERDVQFIDVRDLAEWTVSMAESRQTGVYNATSPRGFVTMGSLLDDCKAVSGSDARFVWVPDQFLLDQEVGPWMELPLWVPLAEAPGFNAIDVGKAVAAGLTFRPVQDTVRDTLSWTETRPSDYEWRAGLDPEKETRVLEAWAAHTH